MSATPYTEDQLIEQPAIALFAELRWQTVSVMEEVFGAGGTLGRETSGDVVLIPRLRAALERLNPQLRSEAIASALDELARDRPARRLRGGAWRREPRVVLPAARGLAEVVGCLTYYARRNTVIR